MGSAGCAELPLSSASRCAVIASPGQDYLPPRDALGLIRNLLSATSNGDLFDLALYTVEQGERLTGARTVRIGREDRDGAITLSLSPSDFPNDFPRRHITAALVMEVGYVLSTRFSGGAVRANAIIDLHGLLRPVRFEDLQQVFQARWREVVQPPYPHLAPSRPTHPLGNQLMRADCSAGNTTYRVFADLAADGAVSNISLVADRRRRPD